MTIIKSKSEDKLEESGRFKPVRSSSLKEIAKNLADGKEHILPESDLLIQDGDLLVQFEYISPEKEEKYVINPGVFALASSHSGIELSKIELKKRNLLESITNTSAIMKEAKVFFSKLHIYEEEGEQKKRGILLYSKPGLGKSSAIEKICLDLIAEDPGTVVVIWPTSEIDADDITAFLSTQSEYTTECTRLILIMEDIGGGERDDHGSRSPVDSGLLNLLDGIGVVFKLPTLIIATTNHPEKLLESLADRPGRFDLMQKIGPPSSEDKIKLMEFFSRRELTDDEQLAITKKGTENFSIAHLKEIRIRALLHDKTYSQVVDELLEHSKLFNNDFVEKTKKVGMM